MRRGRQHPSPTALLALSMLFLPTMAANLPARPPSDLPEQAIRFATRLEESLDSCRPVLLQSSIDFEAVVRRGIDDLAGSPAIKQQFAQGVAENFALGPEICRAVEQSGSYRLLRMRRVEGRPSALFRLVSEGGLNYHEMLLELRAGQPVRIIDIYVHAMGEWTSQAVRRGYLPLADQLQQGPLNSMRPGENAYLDSVPKILEMQKLYRQGRARDALRIFDSLPAELRQHRNILMLRFALTVDLGGAEYETAMADLQRAFPDDSGLSLVLIDHYFGRGEYDRALRLVDRVDDAVDGDAYLDFLRSNLLHAAGRSPEAKRVARRALEREPDLEDAYWSLVTISLDEQDFRTTAGLLLELEGNLGVSIGDLRTVPEYREFVDSEAYREWLAAR